MENEGREKAKNLQINGAGSWKVVWYGKYDKGNCTTKHNQKSNRATQNDGNESWGRAYRNQNEKNKYTDDELDDEDDNARAAY